MFQPDPGRAQRAAWLRLVLTPGVGPATARSLLAAFGLPEDIFAASPAALARVAGDAIAAALRQPDQHTCSRIEQSLDWAQSPENHLLCLSDPGYPTRLLEIADPPPVLFVRGNPALLSQTLLAIVGSRSASRSGLETARAFARSLAQAGLGITSGLAAGIDAAAHAGAIGTEAGTVAVLGTGVDTPYPASNRLLADQIIASGGALVSEFALGTEPRAANFPRRNRVIAGLSLGVLVIEAAMRSGSLITARQAGEYGREVFAIPGSIHSSLSKGCHHLIKQGAKLAENAQDVLDELPELQLLPNLQAGYGLQALPEIGRLSDAARLTKPTPAVPAPSSQELTEQAGVFHHESGQSGHQRALLDALGWDPVSVDTLSARLAPERAEAAAVAANLLTLELAGLVEQLADGRFQRRPSP